MSFKAQLLELHLLRCQGCGQKIASIHRRVKLVGTVTNIDMLGVEDGIAVWCKRCHVATEYQFTDPPAVEVA